MLKLLLTATTFAILATAHAWQPAPDSMLTEWGAKLTPETAWREYPRPTFVRENWTNLNGLWQYAITPQAAATPPASWAGEILVPFAIESALSGVKQRLTAADALWYRRSFDAPVPSGDHRTLLNFEAVDYQSTVWVNDTLVGSHTGGFLPFSFDITAALKPGTNTLTVKVTDATDQDGTYQLHGKQVGKPGGIWYTPVTGIWQTVWLEQVPATHLTAAKITPAISGKVTLELTTTAATEATVIASLAGKEMARTTGPAAKLTLTIPEPKLWSPASPTLYDLTITAGEDTVKSYVGLRETTVIKDADGHLRLALNGKPLFHWGTLDQGWWPDGLLTPPSHAAMISDIQFLKDAGFNTIRKHIKVEPRTYYAYCDRVGMLVWQDQVSAGPGRKAAAASVSPPWTRLAPNPADATWPEAAHRQYLTEFKGMIDTLHNHPSIVQWVPFNEAWGQHQTEEVGNWAMDYDPTRQVNVASGGNFFPAGHIVDAHQYPHPGFPFNQDADGRFDKFVKVVGEFGGHGFPVQDHLWNPKARNWGYGGLPKDKAEWLERYQTSIGKLAELKGQGIAAGIYTQTTDVEGEINGLITYDRKVRKLEPAVLADIHSKAGLLATASAAEKPNILLVLLDDLGYSDLGCYGGEIATPNIDSLANHGLRFTHMSNSARCCPTRASLLTGLHPAQAGIPNMGGQLSENSATLAEVLRGAGYRTYMAGKWHVGNSPQASPTARGFDEFYGFTNGYSADQWDPKNYKRLPAGYKPEICYKPGTFYATDAFTDYALEFISQASGERKPWFLYLAHSAPHFPIQAPSESAKPYLETYRKGWDVLREERFSKLKQIGLIDHDGWKLSPLSIVPVEANNAIANGYSGQPNPAWNSLDAARRDDLAHRMALYAAMVNHVDAGIGRIVKQLKDAGTFENTIILLLSDNGACYEWGPFGFDGPSRAGTTTLYQGDALTTMGGPGTNMSYGSAWANLCNTPFRLYKHFAHEGGIVTPFVVHWPQGVQQPDRWVRDPAHVMDVMPTLVEISGATYPSERNGKPVIPFEGVSLAPTFRSTAALPERAICTQHEGARAIRKGQWKLVLGKRFPQKATWELYDIKADPCELSDLAAQHPDLVASLTNEWEAWAQRTGTLKPAAATQSASGNGGKKNAKQQTTP